MERVCSNAAKLAQFFTENYKDITVNYPGLTDSRWHDIAAKQFGDNGYGGIITIRTGSKEKAFGIIDALKLPLIVSNIGDTKTLVFHYQQPEHSKDRIEYRRYEDVDYSSGVNAECT